MRKKLCRYEFSPFVITERGFGALCRFQSFGGGNNELIDMWQPRYSPATACLFTRHCQSHFSRSDLRFVTPRISSWWFINRKKFPFWHRRTKIGFPRFRKFSPGAPVDIQSTRKCLLISPVRFQSTLKISNMLSHLFSLTQKRDKLGCLPSVRCHSPFSRREGNRQNKFNKGPPSGLSFAILNHSIERTFGCSSDGPEIEARREKRASRGEQSEAKN